MESSDEMEEAMELSSKELKELRKRLQRTDRSFRKKTDGQRRASAELPDLPRGQVRSIASSGAEVECVGGERLCCVTAGQLKHTTRGERDLLAVGDWVRIRPPGEGSHIGTIVAIEPRRTVLVRAEHFLRHTRHVLAANVDQVVITLSIGIPALRPALLDRMRIMAESGGLQPVVCFTKMDLAHTAPEQRALAERIGALLCSQGIPVVYLAQPLDDGLQELQSLLKGKLSVFAGQSGVGKSTLITALTGVQLRVGPVITSTRKGAHTTTGASSVPLHCGGYLIDTPGIRSFGVWDLEPGSIQRHFPEIDAVAQSCRFADCRHLQEPGCAVRAAITSGEVLPERLESLHTLQAGVGLRDLLEGTEGQG